LYCQQENFGLPVWPALLQELKSSRLRLQGIRKLGCPAHINIFEYEVFPDYKFAVTDVGMLSKKSEIKQRKERMEALKDTLLKKEKVNVFRK